MSCTCYLDADSARSQDGGPRYARLERCVIAWWRRSGPATATACSRWPHLCMGQQQGLRMGLPCKHHDVHQPVSGSGCLNRWEIEPRSAWGGAPAEAAPERLPPACAPQSGPACGGAPTAHTVCGALAWEPGGFLSNNRLALHPLSLPVPPRRLVRVVYEVSGWDPAQLGAASDVGGGQEMVRRTAAEHTACVRANAARCWAPCGRGQLLPGGVWGCPASECPAGLYPAFSQAGGCTKELHGRLGAADEGD